ncbi:MAG: RHS repeat-associated core domain-containing protein [Phycisphaerae bacterium]|nr:RHS repeat-associated core domain-containing protein [Phycisphaerae bacterium]
MCAGPGTHLSLTETRTYDEFGNLETIINPRGIKTSFTYDLRNRVATRKEDDRTGGLNLLTQWMTDGNNNLSRQIDANGHSTWYYFDNQGFLSRVVDAAGYETVYTRDYVGNVVRVDRGLSTGTGGPYRSVAFTYDVLDRVLTETVDPDSLALTTQYEYATTSLNCSCGGTPGQSLIHKVTDPRGKVSYAYYDKLDRLTTVVRKVTDTADNQGQNDPDDAVTTVTYDAMGNLTAVVYPEGEQVNRVYDGANRLTQQIAVGGSTSYTKAITYDGADNVITMDMPNGNQVSLTYDAANRPLSGSDNNGALASMTYDANGNLFTRTDGLSHTWTFQYDEADRRTRAYDPLVESGTDKYTTFVYDEVGNHIETVNNLGVRTRFNYDVINRLTSQVEDYQGTSTSTANTTTGYTYNGPGDLLTLTDHDSNTTTYTYNTAGRIYTVTYPDAGVVTYTFDDAGNLTNRLDQKGVTTTYVPNDLDQVTSRSYSTGRSESFTWNRSGRLLTANNTNAQLTFTYDPFGRAGSTTQAFDSGNTSYTTGFLYSIGYGSGRTIRYPTYPSGRIVNESYDYRGLMIDVADENGDFDTSWIYNLANLPTVVYPGNAMSVFTWDVNNRLGRVRHYDNSTKVLDTSFGYDAAGNRTYTRNNMTASHSELYAHDARNRLVDMQRGTLNTANTAITTPLLDPLMPSQQQWNQGNGLDRRGNWLDFRATLNGSTTQQIRTANEVNEYLLVGGTVVSHDDNGNMTADPTARNAGDGLTPTGQAYTFDEENRLTAVRRVSDNALLQEIKYDAFGRRIESLDYMDPTTGVVSTTPVRTRHIYNGLKVIQEYTVTGSGEEQTSALAREFVWGKRFPNQEVMIDYTAAGDVEANTAEVLYFLHGALGSVTGLADASGNLVEKYEYDPYGRTYISAPDGTARPVSAYGNPFAWTGQRYDPAVRLYHFWARSYSPALGRWLQRDPLGYVDGVGLYEYVAGQPLDYYDPYGLWWDTIIDVCSLASDLYDWGKQVKTQIDFILDKPGVSYGDAKKAGEEAAKDALAIEGDALSTLLPGVTGGGKAAKAAVSKLDDAGDAKRVVTQVPPTGPQPPRRVTNPKHHPNSRSPEPANAQELSDNAIEDANGTRWAIDSDGTIHRFSKPSNGESHWNGSTSGDKPIRMEDIPVEIRRRLLQ